MEVMRAKRNAPGFSQEIFTQKNHFRYQIGSVWPSDKSRATGYLNNFVYPIMGLEMTSGSTTRLDGGWVQNG